MEPIRSDDLLKNLKNWIGQNIYIHIEINPGAYFRNGKASLYNVHVKGNQTVRVFLELDQHDSIIHVDDLTHMMMTNELVVISGYDELDRLARTLEISLKPFSI